MLNALLVLEILVCGWDTMVLPNPIGNLMLKVNGGTPYICCCSKILRRCADGGGDGSNEMVDSANMVAKFR